MNISGSSDHRPGGRWRKLRAWAFAAALLAATSSLMLVGLEPREWACEVTFIAAHLLAAEAIMAGHRRD